MSVETEEKEKPINAPSELSYSREIKIRKSVIDWLMLNLSVKGSTKTALADACGVTKQSVSNWFVDGRVKPANLLAAATFFGVEPPYDLMATSKATEKSDPLAYNWRPELRTLVGKLVRDNEKRGALYAKKAKALCAIYDAMSYQESEVEVSLRRSYSIEMNDKVRIEHVLHADDGVFSIVKQAGEFIYLELDGQQEFVFPASPSNEKIVTDAIISMSSAFNPDTSKVASIGDIGKVNENILLNMGFVIKKL